MQVASPIKRRMAPLPSAISSTSPTPGSAETWSTGLIEAASDWAPSLTRWAHELAHAQQVVVANCQFFGGGMQMAPSASPTDGVFDVIVVKNAGKIETMRGINDFLAGKHLDNGNPKIELLYGKRISVSSPEKVRIDLDGEDVGFLPALFEIQPSAIEFITPR